MTYLLGIVCILLTILACLANATMPAGRPEAVGGAFELVANQSDSGLINLRAKAQQPVDEPVARPGQPIAEIPRLQTQPITIKEIQEWMGKKFDVVVLVNKSTSDQSISVYKNINGKAVEIINDRVSTGTEEYRCHYVVDKPSQSIIEARKVFTQTPTGCYNIGSLDIDHYSKAYDDAHMTHAVFLRDPINERTGLPSETVKGIATHRAPGKIAEELIGNRESHACIRLLPGIAKDVFKQVALAGPPFSLQDPDLQGKCDPKEDAQTCGRGAAARTAEYQKFLAPILQQHPNYEAKEYEVPVVSRDCRIVKDPSTGADRTIKGGYRALIIVQDIETGPKEDVIWEKDPKTGKVYSRPVNHTDTPCAAAEGAPTAQTAPSGPTPQFRVPIFSDFFDALTKRR